jgi:hypothetical protein
MQFALRSTTGIDIDPIAPDQVTKDDQGNIHVAMTGTSPQGPTEWNFFTSKAECDKFVTDNGITPQQAPEGDIN